MPRSLTLAEYDLFVITIGNYLKKAKSRRAWLRPKQLAKVLPPRLVVIATKAKNFEIVFAKAMVSIFWKLHLKQGTHRAMKALALQNKVDLTRLFKISRVWEKEPDDVMRALELLALDSHHITPAGSHSRFRAIRALFATEDDMDAVLITVLEHRAGVERLRELVPNGGLGVLVSKKSITSDINKIVAKHKGLLDQDLNGPGGGAWIALEKLHAQNMIDELIDYYRRETPDLLGSGPGSVHATLLKVRGDIAGLTSLKP